MRVLLGSIFFVTALFAQVGGCSASDPQNPARDAAPGTSSQGPSKTESAKVESMTEEEAIRLAETHLALRKAGWGKAQGVSELDDKFYVTYETPERELRLIGQRVVIVDKESRVVSFQKRR